ncbi:hypothetical protein FQN54_006124 [Arachnomyces sp. PD_36]|nr:hypothetical protein FQN54_006124 [Arachnomyces sp. PD_36]
MYRAKGYIGDYNLLSKLGARTIPSGSIGTRYTHLNKPLQSSIASTTTRSSPFATTSANMTIISDTIKSDHREIEEYYKKITNSNDEDEIVRYQNQFVWELARHSIGEELVVYPAFEKHLSEGKEMADRDRSEHLTVKEYLKKFQNMTPTDPNFSTTLNELMNNLSKHIKEEESDDLPKLENALAKNDSEALSTSFGRTKAFVPSRSHPSAPDKPPFETAVGLLTAPIDHVADMFRKFPDQTISPNPSTK